MAVPITALYAGILAIIGLFLAMRVGGERVRTKVSLGTGDDLALLEAVRRHANFIENVPLALVLFALLELNGASGTALHVLGASLVVARLAHPVGLHMNQMMHKMRMVGSLGTTLVILAAAVMAILQYF